MRKFRFFAFVVSIILSISGHAQAETRGNLFLSTGFSYGFFESRELPVATNVTLLRLNVAKLGIGWEMPAGPGLFALGLEAGFSSGSRFGGRGGVDYFPMAFTTSYVLPLAPALYFGPSLRMGGLFKAHSDWSELNPMAGARLEAELRSRNFPFGLYAAGGVDAFIPRDYEYSILPVVEVGLRFPRGRLPRREASARTIPAEATVEAPPPAVRQQPPPPAVPVTEDIQDIEDQPPIYTPVPIPSRVGYTLDGRQGILHPLFFVPETTVFMESSIPIMDNVGRRLVANPELRVLVRAFAISEGPDDFRYLLSVNRSRVVRDYFIRHFGIAPARIIIEAYGTDRVLQREIDDWEPNRCAELLVFEN